MWYSLTYCLQRFNSAPALAISKWIGSIAFNSQVIGVVSIRNPVIADCKGLRCLATSIGGSLISPASSNVSKNAVHCALFALFALPAGVVQLRNSHRVLANSVLDSCGYFFLVHWISSTIDRTTRLGKRDYAMVFSVSTN